MFQPNLGRWMQEDPIGFEGGDSNLYRYVGNNPATEVDPWGQQGEKEKAENFHIPKGVTLEKAALKDAEKILGKIPEPVAKFFDHQAKVTVDLPVTCTGKTLSVGSAKVTNVDRGALGKLPDPPSLKWGPIEIGQDEEIVVSNQVTTVTGPSSATVRVTVSWRLVSKAGIKIKGGGTEEPIKEIPLGVAVVDFKVSCPMAKDGTKGGGPGGC